MQTQTSNVGVGITQSSGLVWEETPACSVTWFIFSITHSTALPWADRHTYTQTHTHAHRRICTFVWCTHESTHIHNKWKHEFTRQIDWSLMVTYVFIIILPICYYYYYNRTNHITSKCINIIIVSTELVYALSPLFPNSCILPSLLPLGAGPCHILIVSIHQLQ